MLKVNDLLVSVYSIMEPNIESAAIGPYTIMYVTSLNFDDRMSVNYRTEPVNEIAELVIR